MRRAVHVALVALLAWGAAPGLEAAPPAPLDLSAARVLASPGWPAVVHGFLPPGREVEPLTLPLPEGPVLVLGLTGSDPAARRLLTENLRLADLRGGYVVDARLEGQHPLALVLAEDAAALAAARFELETFAGAKDGAARSLDMTKPDEEGGVRIAAGRRQVTPRFRIRGLAGEEEGSAVLQAPGAHANRFWLPEGKPKSVGRPRVLARLAEHGVVATAHARVDVDGRAIDATPALAHLKAWQEHGVRHFAVLLSRPARVDLSGATDGPWRVGSIRGPVTQAALPPPSTTRAAHAEVVRSLVRGLRPGGLDELLVVPPLGSDPSEWPDMTGIPEIQVGWSGPSARPVEVGVAEARRVAQLASVPVVFVETWMDRVSGVPSLPRGRDPRLGDVLRGVVVLPGPGAAEALAQAWAPSGAPSDLEPALADLLDCCVTDPTDVEAWLIASAENVDRSLEGRFDAPLWQRQLPAELRGAASALRATEARLLAWYDPTEAARGVPPRASAWEAAAPLTLGAAELRAVSDGHRVFLRLRVANKDVPRRFALSLGTPEASVDLDLTQRGPVGFPAGRGRVLQEGSDVVAYLRLERDVLYGDPHPGRSVHMHLEIQAGTDAQGPAHGSSGPPRVVSTVALIVVR